MDPSQAATAPSSKTTKDPIPLPPEPRRALADRPRLVYWEVTRACDLACRHCRATAVPDPHPLELSTEEGRGLLAQVAGFEGPPHLVLTGGDPLRRADLFDLIAHAQNLGLPVSVTPAGTARLTPGVVRKLKGAGVRSLGLSLDGADPDLHDGLRGEPGSFDATVRAIRAAGDAGLPVQVNTLVSADTLPALPAVRDLVRDLEAARWALFFLVRTGRGRALSEVTPIEAEALLNRLADGVLDGTRPTVKTTEAHHLRRIVHARLAARGTGDAAFFSTPAGRAAGIRDGCGVCFVSHRGEVYPSGFLPRSAGNVRDRPLSEIYREGDLFRALRDPDRFRGKCGRCPYRWICGGSRARAFAETGDPLASDPLCAYQP